MTLNINSSAFSTGYLIHSQQYLTAYPFNVEAIKTVNCFKGNVFDDLIGS